MKTWGLYVCLWDSTISHLRLAHHKTRLSNESCRWINYIWSLDLYQFYVLWTSWWYWTFCIAQYSSLLIFSLLQTWGHKGNLIVPKKVSQLLVLGPFYGCTALIHLSFMLAWFWTKIAGGWHNQSHTITSKGNQTQPLLEAKNINLCHVTNALAGPLRQLWVKETILTRKTPFAVCQNA